MISKLLFFSWLSGITIASLVDYSTVTGLGLSKGFGTGFWMHAGAYFLAGCLFVVAFGGSGHRIFLPALIALFLLGIIFEVVQLRLPRRTFNPIDIAANGIGLIAFYGCYSLNRIKSKATIPKSSRNGAETLEDGRKIR